MLNAHFPRVCFISPSTFFWGYISYILMFQYHNAIIGVFRAFLAQIHTFAFKPLFVIFLCRKLPSSWQKSLNLFTLVVNGTGKTFTCITFMLMIIGLHTTFTASHSHWGLLPDFSLCRPFLEDTSPHSVFWPERNRLSCERFCCRCSVQAFWCTHPEFALPFYDPKGDRSQQRKEQCMWSRWWLCHQWSNLQL